MHKLKYKLAQMKFSELKEKIEIPKFQRGLVWGSEKKKEFIKSLKDGLPIGVLLLSKKGEKYLVIDGLQRFTTMLEYSKDYFSYIEASEITDTDILSIVIACDKAKQIFDNHTEAAQTAIKEKIRKIIVENIRTGLNKNSNQISQSIAVQLCKDIAEFPADCILSILSAVFIIVEDFSKTAKIDDVELPLIIFDGKDDELATVFQKLNQEGVKLSKYDVFAATWIDYTVKVKNDPDFIKQIIKKYEASQDKSGLEISNYDPEKMLSTGELTAFEYAFALGKELIDKCPILFNAKKDDSKVESIGFLILAELFGLSYQSMNKLAAQMCQHKNLDFVKLKNVVIETAKLVQSALGDFIVAPTKKKSSLACHSELQVASYIIVLFKLRYEITLKDGLIEKGGKNKEVKEVKYYLYKHYLYDILRGHWSGSGDSKLEEIIADPAICRYVKDVNRDSFEQVISEWLISFNKKNNQTNVTAETKLFLNYLLRLSINPKEDYDIEHCVPKKVLQDYFVKKSIAVPISAACNLVYIPASENRGKGDWTYYQKQNHDAKTFTLNSDALDALAYPRAKDLTFVESVPTITPENYFSFLNDRVPFITHRMITKLYE